MKCYAIFKSRSFADTRQPALTIAVDRFSFDAIGGCVEARLTCTEGSDYELFDLMKRLRQEVKILDETGSVVWWGYVHEVQANVGEVQVGVSLGSMANSVAVAYSKMEPGATGAGERETTAWSADSSSVAEYGTKQSLLSLSNATTDMAESYRDSALALSKLPIPVVTPEGNGKSHAVVTLRGWMDTLAWKYYTGPDGREVYEDTSVSDQNMGRSSSTEKVAQSFSLVSGGPWLLAQADIRIRIVGAPADGVIVKLYSDVAGAPGVLLATSGTIPASSITADFDWIAFTFPAPYQSIVFGTTYWLVVERSGALDTDNYYEVNVNQALGYARGVFRIYNVIWTTRAPDADMQFRALGVRETNDLVSDTVTSVGQFISGTEMDDSGTYSAPHRDGDQSGLDVILELLKAGNSAGKRFLCEVTQLRNFRAWPEPAKGSVPELFLTRDAKLLDRTGAEIRTSPVGQWVYLKDVVPPNVDILLMSDPTWAFVERAEYIVKDGAWRPQFRGEQSPWTVGEVSLG